MRRIWLALGAALALGACETTSPYAGAPASAHDGERFDETSSEDMFILRIDVGRTHIFNDRIETVLDAMPDPVEPDAVASVEDNERARAAFELKDAAGSVRSVTLEYLQLEGEACAKGKFVELTCKGGEVPAWLSEPANKPVSAAEVQRRLEWVQERMGPLMDAACEKGKTLIPEDDGGGPMFCSVE